MILETMRLSKDTVRGIDGRDYQISTLLHGNLLFLFCSCLCLQKHPYGKDLYYKGLSNDDVYRKKIWPNSATGGMVLGSGSTTPPNSRGIRIHKLIDPPYKDMSVGDDEETPMFGSQTVLSSGGKGGSSVNKRSGP